MKTVRIHMRWENSVEVEVDDDFEMPDVLDGFPDEVLEQMDVAGAELVDWDGTALGTRQQ